MNTTPRILIVDDDPDVLQFLSQIIQSAGYDVAEASSGHDCLRKVRESHIDVILLDVVLPDLSGIEVCRQIKGDAALHDVFVVLCSGNATSVAHKVDGLGSGADDYILKPADPAELLARIRTILRLRNTTAALRSSEQHYRQLIEILPDAVVTIDLQFRLMSVNPQAVKMLGYANEAELLCKNIFDLTPPEEHERIRTDITTSLASGVFRNGEYTMLRKNGSRFSGEANSAALLDTQGRPFGLVGMVRDITQRKHAEEILRISEERFRQVAENIKEVFWMTDPAKNQMLYISPAYEEIWGRSCESLYASPASWIEALHPDDRERVMEAAVTKQVLGEYDEVYRIVRPDGATRWIHDRAFPVRDSSGNVYRVAGIAEDITKRRQSEEALRESEARKSAIMQSALDAIVTIDHKGRITDFNPAAEKMFGVVGRKVLGREMALVIIPPSLREWFRGGLAHSFTSDAGPTLDSRIETTALRADATEFPVEFSITRIELAGPPIFTTFIRDISRRKRAEERIQLLAYAVQTAHEYISITDHENRFTFVNQAFLENYGYTEKEVLGRTPEFLYSPKNPPGLCEQVYQKTLTNEWRGELLNLRKDGTEFPISLSTSQIKNDKGSILGLIGVARDISMRKLAEEELRRLHRRIIEAQEDERLRVARELHDGVNQIIASAKMRLRKVEDNIAALNPAAREILSRCGDLLVKALEENRRIAHDLRPSDLDNLGLAAACRNLCKEFQSRSGLTVKTSIAPLDRLPSHVELHLFRILQEALTNAEKHARARKIRVRLAHQGDVILLKVHDDGRGFDPNSPQTAKRKGRGAGLGNMRERAAFLGGSYDVASAPKQGTTITIRVPCDAAK